MLMLGLQRMTKLTGMTKVATGQVSKGDQVVKVHNRIYKDQPLVGKKREKKIGSLMYVG